jgi:two-component system, NarL family, nitrate/nitrite response regulator NarL
MSLPRVRVYLADDHPLFLEGVARAVRACEELELVGSATCGEQTLADLRRLRPDVAVIDVRLRGAGAREILEAARHEGLPTRIVVLTADLEEDLVYELLAAGAAGYLSKEADRDAVLAAVAAAARNEVVISPVAQTGLVRELRRREAHAGVKLTPREREVLALAAEGVTTIEIAARLELSATTVKTHLQKAYEKLGVTDRTAAVALALRRGLLD